MSAGEWELEALCAAAFGIPPHAVPVGSGQRPGPEEPSHQLCRQRVPCCWERLPGCWLQSRSGREEMVEKGHKFGAIVGNRRAGAALEKNSEFRASQGRWSEGEEWSFLLKSFWLGQPLGLAAKFMLFAHAKSLHSFHCCLPSLSYHSTAGQGEPPLQCQAAPCSLGWGTGKAAGQYWHPSPVLFMGHWLLGYLPEDCSTALCGETSGVFSTERELRWG